MKRCQRPRRLAQRTTTTAGTVAALTLTTGLPVQANTDPNDF